VHDLSGVFEHADEQSLFAGEVVIQAARVRIGLSQDRGDSRGVVPLLVKEPEGHIEDARLGIGGGDELTLTRGLNDRSSVI
jgi:hypothetical protein